MAGIAMEMLRDALECFLQEDERKAFDVCRRDAEVDELNRKVYREFARGIADNPATVNKALEMMFIAKSLERVADHASNIAEEMIYLAKGRDIRHTPEVKNLRPE
jgi:phosphate transport system protein